MADDRVELLVGGTLYGGWKAAGVTRALDAASGTYKLTVTDRWAGQAQPWPISPGDQCEVRVAGQTLIVGYVDIVRSSFTAESRSIEIQGRDRAADMVDCSAIHDPDEWRGIDLLRLANILGQPFGVTTAAEADVGAPFDLVKLNQGETAHEALTRYAKTRKLLVAADGKGGLLLTRAGTRRAAVELVQGQNLLEGSGTLDWSERFSDYVVKGQANFSEDSDPETEAFVVGQARDAYVGRYRPLQVNADADANGQTALERATWEANTRLAKSAAGSVKVQGWRQAPGGALWEPNLLVRVRAPWMRLEGEMLVRQVTFSKGPEGTTTQLELVSPQAFEPEPPDGRQGKRPRAGGSRSENPWLTSISEEVRRD